jgi:hypothetical protein
VLWLSAAEVNDVIESLGQLVEAGHSAAVVPLAEQAHRLADAAVNHVDDSDGSLVDISQRVGELLLEACRLARPDPVELARRLVDLELTSELGAFHRAAAIYAEVLGQSGWPSTGDWSSPRWRALGSGSRG